MPARIDPRGWLLIAIAGWALLCAVVAVSGFGGRYRLLADDPSQLESLPSVASANTASPLGPMADYAAASERPLFYADRKPIAVHVAGSGDAGRPLDVTLTSVLITPSLQMVIVQDNHTGKSFRAHEGQPLEGDYAGWRLVAMTPRSAVFDGGAQGKITLQLRVFDGHGGEPPTNAGPEALANGMPGAPPSSPAPAASVQANGAGPASSDNQSPSAVATLAAAEAQRQAEQIRQRIEARRLQAQGQAGNAPQPNDKR